MEAARLVRCTPCTSTGLEPCPRPWWRHELVFQTTGLQALITPGNADLHAASLTFEAARTTGPLTMFCPGALTRLREGISGRPRQLADLERQGKETVPRAAGIKGSSTSSHGLPAPQPALHLWHSPGFSSAAPEALCFSIPYRQAEGENLAGGKAAERSLRHQGTRVYPPSHLSEYPPAVRKDLTDEKPPLCSRSRALQQTPGAFPHPVRQPRSGRHPGGWHTERCQMQRLLKATEVEDMPGSRPAPGECPRERYSRYYARSGRQ